MRIVVPAEGSGALSEAWRRCVGTGRFELALRRDYQESLALVQKEIGFRHIRGHGLLSDGVGIHRPFDYQGIPHVRYAFTYVDQVIDAYLELGIQPFVELGFMPEALASGDETVFWWRGNITPPRSFEDWAALVRATIGHFVDRYGVETVRGWPIEVWNEPNLKEFWAGADDSAYHHLYEVTAKAVKEVDAELQVGGPSLSPGADDWLPRFAEFVQRRSAPVDFVSKHAYTSGPAQHVPFGTYQKLKPATNLLEQFATPRQLLAGTALEGLPVHITEFNSSYRPDNPIHDTAFHAAYLAPVVTAAGDLVDSFSYWTFCDVFEEAGVPTTPLHGGFGLLTYKQIKKPTYHLYAFMARMGGEVLHRDENCLVTRHADGRVTVLAWTLEGGSQKLSIPLARAASAFYVRSSVSEDKGNVFAAWGEMGRPMSLRPKQLETLRELAEPSRTHGRLAVTLGLRDGGTAGGMKTARADLDLFLERHEVTLVEISPVERDETPPWWDDERVYG